MNILKLDLSANSSQTIEDWANTTNLLIDNANEINGGSLANTYSTITYTNNYINSKIANTKIYIDNKVESLGAASNTYITANFQAISQKGKSNGYASLDSNGKIPADQINRTLTQKVVTNITGNTINETYNPPLLLFKNGVKLLPEDYTAANGTVVTLAHAATTRDVFNLVCFETTNVLNAVSAGEFSNHTGNQLNPHNTTKAQVGLGNVDNTSDILKPLSNSTIGALLLKAEKNDTVLTGTPVAPTATLGTRTTQISTTNFVGLEIDKALENLPRILPFNITSPANNTTLPQGTTYTFVADPFYSDYGLKLNTIVLDFFDTSNNLFKTYSISAPNDTTNNVSVNLQALGLATNTNYIVEMTYIDIKSNSRKSSNRITFKTPTQFKVAIGQAYEGGFLAFENYGDGNLFDLVIAPKSTELLRFWDSNDSRILVDSLSRVSGDRNTDRIISRYSGNQNYAAFYAKSITIGNVAGYLASIDEARSISHKLRPANASVAAFQTGGSEVFNTGGSNNIYYWSSTEHNASNSWFCQMAQGSQNTESKNSSMTARAIKRIQLTPPYTIGTPMEGGYLAAYFTDLSTGSPITYMLIISDKSTQVSRSYAEVSADNGASSTSRTNGKSWTEGNQGQSGNYPAIFYCYNLVSGGKDDWYLGAIDEMLTVARMNLGLPSDQQLPVSNVWSSTEFDTGNTRYVSSVPPSTGAPQEAYTGKTASLTVRAIRRVQLYVG